MNYLSKTFRETNETMLYYILRGEMLSDPRPPRMLCRTGMATEKEAKAVIVCEWAWARA